MLALSDKIKSAAAALRDPKAAPTIARTISGIIEGEIWRRAIPAIQPPLRAIQRGLYDATYGQEMGLAEAADRLDKIAELQAAEEPVNMTRAQFNAALAREYERGYDQARGDYLREQCAGVSDVMRGEEPVDNAHNA